MNNSLRLILIGAGIMLTCVIVVICFFIYKESKNTSNKGLNQIMDITLDEQEISYYNGLDISGAELISIMERYRSEPIFMRVKTKACISLYGVYYNHGYTDGVLDDAGSYDVTTASKEDLINPSEQFRCSVYKNELDVITGLIFVQK